MCAAQMVTQTKAKMSSQTGECEVGGDGADNEEAKLKVFMDKRS